MTTKHPAKYSNQLLPILAELVQGCGHIHDPFAGTGRIFELALHGFGGRITASEIEPEWAACHADIEIADVLCLPYPSGWCDGIVTSPAYGNRMADSFIPGEGWGNARSKRNTYTHALGRKLHLHNSGQLQWGDKYRDFHERAWAECGRVLVPGGRLVLNVSDHIRGGEVQAVTDWHVGCLERLGFVVEEWRNVATRRQRWGQNGDVRVAHESVIRLERLR